ncbi:MAG: hypothetical protein GWN94_19850 [Phycisphaerae bacterium]|nr:hypothetical protein [Phycisphaerae bacterium]NIS53328.1 hypothetical protein [Phycisphaerae bacterium]NIX30482.1 hypothetical protein [Phycisphaerae bacterium]
MDETTKIISCPCGLDNHLVLKDTPEPGTNRMVPTWHYDEKKHGNGEPAEGKCFNCHAPLDGLSEEAAEEQQTPEAVEKPLVAKMKKDELLEVAESLAIEVPAGAKKADIIELIETKQEESEESEDGEEE